jgi:hypothetical protein
LKYLTQLSVGGQNRIPVKSATLTVFVMCCYALAMTLHFTIKAYHWRFFVLTTEANTKAEMVQIPVEQGQKNNRAVPSLKAHFRQSG